MDEGALIAASSDCNVSFFDPLLSIWGLVSRARDVDDARASRLRLSERGEEAICRFLLARHQWLTTLLADWPPEERDDFARLICLFADDIHRHLDDLDI